MRYGYYHSPVGRLTLASENDALTGLWMEGQRNYGATLSTNAIEDKTCSILLQAFCWLDRYFSGTCPDSGELPLAPSGTAFQQRVWQLLREIPYGSVTTYGELANQLGYSSPRAMGGAVGRNPISVIIPCHRVIGADGRLTGYTGGVERKRWLLEFEGAMRKFQLK